MLDKLSHKDFKGRVGERFTATPKSPKGPRLHLELTDVDIRGKKPSGDHRQPFALTFRDESHRHVPQGTYRVQHKDMGKFDLFLVPTGPGPHGMHYEAAFG
jgi:hypothetical protein